MSRLDSKPVDELQLKRIQDLNVAARYLEYRINELCPKGRERKIALQRLEEVVCEQIKLLVMRCSND